MRWSLAGAALASLVVAGCVHTGPGAGTRSTALIPAPSPEPPNSSAATWRMPWQISPIAAGRGERITTSYVPETGLVRGTPEALASIGRPLQAAAGRNRTVDACRTVVEGEATKVGARNVEAVSAGPDRLDPKGRYVAPVRMRITYARSEGLEVREAMLTCVVDRRGKIVDAYA